MGRQDEEEVGDGCVTMLIPIDQNPQIVVVRVCHELERLENDVMTFQDIPVHDTYIPH